jgi:hypothetical protein
VLEIAEKSLEMLEGVYRNILGIRRVQNMS